MFFDVFAGTLAALIAFFFLHSWGAARAVRQRERAEERAYSLQLEREKDARRCEDEKWEREKREAEARRARINAECETRDRRIFDQMIELDVPQIQLWAVYIAEQWGWPGRDRRVCADSCVNVPFDDPKIVRAGELNCSANASRNMREWHARRASSHLSE